MVALLPVDAFLAGLLAILLGAFLVAAVVDFFAGVDAVFVFALVAVVVEDDLVVEGLVATLDLVDGVFFAVDDAGFVAFAAVAFLITGLAFVVDAFFVGAVVSFFAGIGLVFWDIIFINN